MICSTNALIKTAGNTVNEIGPDTVLSNDFRFSGGTYPQLLCDVERGWVLPIADGCGWLLLLLSPLPPVSVGRTAARP